MKLWIEQTTYYVIDKLCPCITNKTFHDFYCDNYGFQLFLYIVMCIIYILYSLHFNQNTHGFFPHLLLCNILYKLFTRLVKYSTGVPLMFWTEKRIHLSSNEARLFTAIMGVENKLQSHIALALNYFRIQHVVSAGTNFLAKYEYIASEIVYWFSLWNIQSVGFAIFISVRPITITYIIGKHRYA